MNGTVSTLVLSKQEAANYGVKESADGSTCTLSKLESGKLIWKSAFAQVIP